MTAAYSHGQEAMLAYLAGDDGVQAAAAQIWQATGDLLSAQRALETATDAYTQAITDTGIPTEHIDRLGAALILRLNRQQLLKETENTGRGEPPA
ncbi:hypothetical protein [Catenulispora pinisilvae]|uniref:hypothetical protein n=1 Tax=Catenulispora pinisilvae TaxID=2705253 RepID=UPI0018927B3C|nr:hypothetical protein [Catenulispora pinisilvae]